jgi:hypothetical protein
MRFTDYPFYRKYSTPIFDKTYFKQYKMKQENPIQNGPPSGLTPILVVNNANEASCFYKQAFDAIEIARIPAPGGIKFIHIRLQVFGTIFIVMDELPEFSGGRAGPVRLLHWVGLRLHFISRWKMPLKFGTKPWMQKLLLL